MIARLFLLLGLLLVSATAQAQDMRFLRDEETEQYLKVMTKDIFGAAGVNPANVRFVLVDDPALNAFVAGGQNIFLNTGLILQTQNVSELTGVIAHETGHIALGHLFRGRSEMGDTGMQAMISTLLGVAVAMGARSAEAGMAVSSAGSTAALRGMLRHTRTQEGSADQAGVRFLEAAHLPISGFLSFMQKLESQELIPEDQQSEYVQTHPLTADRIDFLKQANATAPSSNTPPGWEELHNRIKEKLRGYLYPDQALASNDMSIAAQYGRVVALSRKGQDDKALVAIEPLIKAEPRNPYFYEQKGQMLLGLGRMDEAAAVYARAVEFAPTSAMIRTSYAQALLGSKNDKVKNRKEAISQLNIAINADRTMAEPHYLIAIAYGQQGQEGLSRLHLAEQALLRGNREFAKREAQLAKANLKKGTPAYLRASDILDIADDGKK